MHHTNPVRPIATALRPPLVRHVHDLVVRIRLRLFLSGVRILDFPRRAAVAVAVAVEAGQTGHPGPEREDIEAVPEGG